MKTTHSEWKRQTRRILPALFSLLLLAVALPLWADSDILTAKLDSSGSGMNWYEDEYGWQTLGFNIESHFPLQGVFAQQSADQSLYETHQTDFCGRTSQEMMPGKDHRSVSAGFCPRGRLGAVAGAERASSRIEQQERMNNEGKSV